MKFRHHFNGRSVEMCGLFGRISRSAFPVSEINGLAMHASQRGKDSSGVMLFVDNVYQVVRADEPIDRLLRKISRIHSPVIMGHSRLITNGLSDNQPVVRENIAVFHNGIIVNDLAYWSASKLKRTLEIDTEVINAIAIEAIQAELEMTEIAEKIISVCEGVVSAAVCIPEKGKLLLLSNNGSLYLGEDSEGIIFASESFPLKQLNCRNVRQLNRMAEIIDVPQSSTILVRDERSRRTDLIPRFKNIAVEERMLVEPVISLQRCNKCILPSTMPFIKFDKEGVCNYCRNYIVRNRPKPITEIQSLVDRYRRSSGPECIVPFSGGRDSCWALHLIVKEMGLKPIAYTYDWGMVTDLGRRNISRMCSALGVENIIIAADIGAKRRNIAMNLRAWLRNPNLGMISILTAGDKHFFKYVETVKGQTGISLNLWGVNPLEVTHFKAGFLGVPPDFEEQRVYRSGIGKQLEYQALRFRAMLRSPSYFNSSLWDTLSGEYYRSFTNKSDYYHIFDYWQWNEAECNRVLSNYQWELAVDTSTTWRIGDGTAAFYNYLYYLIAGFTEHDTFRSNQIREGQIEREEALRLVKDENRPRYQNIRWYLDAIGLDYMDVIRKVNAIPRLYETL